MPLEMDGMDKGRRHSEEVMEPGAWSDTDTRKKRESKVIATKSEAQVTEMILLTEVGKAETAVYIKKTWLLCFLLEKI